MRRFAFALAALTLTACAEEATPPALIGKGWSAIEIGGAPPAGPAPTLSIADGRVSGSGGCNSYSGEAQVKGASVKFLGVAMTEMACLDAAVMETEQVFMEALNATARAEYSEGELTFLSKDGEALVRFTQSPAPS
jgi:heat shock protein HslJ